MSGFSSLGIGSGLDLDGLVQGLLRAEREPQDARLNRHRETAQTTLSALGTLRSAVAGLMTSVKALDGFEVGLRASSSDATRVEVSESGAAEPGSFQLRVMELATAQSLATTAFADQETQLGAGTLTLGVGDESVVLTLTEGASSLRDVRDAINNSGLDVQAVIVRDGEQFRLLLTSGKTGIGGELSLAVSGSVDSRLSSAGMDVTAAAQDALFSVNGLTLASKSNTVEGVLPGITLTLRAPTEGGDVITVSVEADLGDARTRVDAMVRAYNALIDNMRSVGRADPEGGNSGPLVGDATLRAIQSRLGGVFSTALANGLADNPFRTLLDIGLSTDLQGRVRLDASKLTAALEDNQTGVEAMLSAFAEHLGRTLEGYGGSGGILDTRRDSLNAQLRRIDDQRQALDKRMEQIEARLRAQFSALDSMLVQFQNTSAYLSQQLAALANLRPGVGG